MADFRKLRRENAVVLLSSSGGVGVRAMAPPRVGQAGEDPRRDSRVRGGFWFRGRPPVKRVQSPGRSSPEV